MVSEADDKIVHEIIESADFNDIVIDSYSGENADSTLSAYHFFARSQMPAGTAAKRNVNNQSTRLPVFDSNKCTGCLDCLSMCPDSAIHGKIVPECDIDFYIEDFSNDKNENKILKKQFVSGEKLSGTSEKVKYENGNLIISIDPSKCKGCDICVNICDNGAFSLSLKNEKPIKSRSTIFEFYNTLPETEKKYFDGDKAANIMLSPESNLFTGGTNACSGCGEISAIRMMLGETGFRYGKENIGIINSSTCSRNFSSTYPYNPFMVSCVNTAPKNQLSLAKGIRERWNQMGWKNKKIWIIANNDILDEMNSKMPDILAENKTDINILVLDKVTNPDNDKFQNLRFFQKNKGISFSKIQASDIENYYKTIKEANEFRGPAIVVVSIHCEPEENIENEIFQINIV